MPTCECGCRQETKIGRDTRLPNRFLFGHSLRLKRTPWNKDRKIPKNQLDKWKESMKKSNPKWGTNIIVKCSNCNKDKKITYGYYNFSESKRFFCNHKCRFEYQKGKNNPFYGRSHTIETNKKNKLFHIGKEQSLETIEKRISKCIGQKRNQETKEKLRKKKIEYISKLTNGGKPIFPKIGKYETPILNKLENVFGFKIIPQYEIGGYFIDGYFPFLKLAIEVDEPIHQYQIEKDIEREEYIKEKLNCTFIRIGIPKEIYYGTV